MGLKNLLDGIEILRKYYNNPDGYNMAAEHDIFYMYSTDRPIINDDLMTLISLDWIQEENVDENGDFTIENYSSDEGWAFYV